MVWLPRRVTQLVLAVLLAGCWLASAPGPARAVHLPAGHRQLLLDPSGEAGDTFGSAVAVDGDTLVVGASNDDGDGIRQGLVIVFERDPVTGWWEYAQPLTDPLGADYDHFGSAVALDGDTLVVGAPYDNGAGSDRGAVHVFSRLPSGAWGGHVELPPPSDAGRFGSSVDVDGDTIVVGAPGSFIPGEVHVLTRGTGGWSHSQELVSPTTANRDSFGASVSIDGNRIVAGSPGVDEERGIVHYFVRGTDDVWDPLTPFTDPDGAPGDHFGRSVAIDWPIVVVGAPYDDDHAADGGAAHGFVYETSIGVPGGTWEHELLPIGGGLAGDADLGRSVAVQGATVVAGAPGDTGVGTERGAIHVFRGGPATKGWTHEQALVDPDGADGNRLGRSVAVDGEWILAGATGEAYEGTTSGVAHAFAETARPEVTITSPADGARYPVNAAVPAAYSCIDLGSGIASCIGTVADGTPIDTSSAGMHTFTVTAFDAVGNFTTVTHTYEIPTCEGLPVTLVAEPGVPLEGTGGPDVILGTDGPDEISGGGGDDTICGLDGDDLLLGGPGDDTLVGGDGKDKLRGAAGDDTLLGGPGSDRLLPEFGFDFVDGGAGSDIVDYLAARGPVSVNLLTGIATYTPGTATWTHTLRAIEKADGSIYADTLVGDNRRNVLRGKQGADTIRGLGDDDDLIGGTDDDQIYGGDGNDLLKGQANDDTLRGEAGNDRIVGGAGSDTLWGGAGNDTLIGGLRTHQGVFSNTIDGGTGTDTCRWDFDNPTNC